MVFRWWNITVSLMVTTALIGACTDTGFKGSSGQRAPVSDKSGTKTSNSTDPGANDTLPDHVVDTGSKNGDVGNENDASPLVTFDESFQGGFLVKPLSPDSITTFWAATIPGNAYWFRLEGDEVAETKRWTGLASAGGSRTFVTEKGAVIARTGGYLYWIDPAATPEGPLSQAMPNHYRIPNAAPEDRACIVSYRKNKKRYVGMGWGLGNFIEFPMDNAPPYAPQWGNASGSTVVPNVLWGYSCYIDQVRLIYYGQWAGGANGVGAVDLKTMTPLDPSGAKNASFISTNVPYVTVGPKGGGSYAINGDSAGNVFNGQGAYTLAHNRVSRTVWGMVQGNLQIFPQQCLTSEPNCTGNVTLPLPEFNGMLPLSALPDGRMIGMKRQPNGQVNLFKLRDTKDLSKGVDVTPIAELEGDPYMYTDFTGAMLYYTKSVTSFELDTVVDFDTSKPNKAVGFTWQSRSATDITWSNIKFEIVCYASSGSKGDFETVDTIKDALKQTIITTNSCKDKAFDRVEIRLTQLADDDTLMNIGRVQVTAYQ